MNMKRSPSELTFSIGFSGQYLIISHFYAQWGGRAAYIYTNNKLNAASFGNDNVQMPVFFCGVLSKNDKIKITSNGGYDNSSVQNQICIIKIN